MLTIHCVPGAPLETNCYLVADIEAGVAIIVDAPWQVVEIMHSLAAQWNVRVLAIVCTHGHWDHTMGLAELRARFNTTVAAHRGDAGMLEHPSFEPFSFPFTLTPVTPDRLLDDGDGIEVGGHTLSVLNTPGHTPGCICLYDAEAKVLMSGDTLFAGSYGRLDLPGGDCEKMVQSLSRLRELPPDTTVYPGHGASTTISREFHWLEHVEEDL